MESNGVSDLLDVGCETKEGVQDGPAQHLAMESPRETGERVRTVGLHVRVPGQAEKAVGSTGWGFRKEALGWR